MGSANKGVKQRRRTSAEVAAAKEEALKAREAKQKAKQREREKRDEANARLKREGIKNGLWSPAIYKAFDQILEKTLPEGGATQAPWKRVAALLNKYALRRVKEHGEPPRKFCAEACYSKFFAVSARRARGATRSRAPCTLTLSPSPPPLHHLPHPAPRRPADQRQARAYRQLFRGRAVASDRVVQRH